MKILLLPGANPKTIKWLKDLCLELHLNFENCELQQYLFWNKPDTEKNLDIEISNITKNIMKLLLLNRWVV